MKNFSQFNGRVQYTNTSGTTIASGAVIVAVSGTNPLTGCIALAEDTITNNQTGTVWVGQCVINPLAAKSTDVWSQFAPLYWDSVNQRLTSTSTDTYAGQAADAKLTNVSTASLLLNVD